MKSIEAFIIDGTRGRSVKSTVVAKEYNIEVLGYQFHLLLVKKELGWVVYEKTTGIRFSGSESFKNVTKARESVHQKIDSYGAKKLFDLIESKPKI